MTDAHLQQFIESLERSLAGGRFVKLTLAKHRGAESDLRNVYVRLVEIKSGESLSFLYRYKTKDVVKNHPFAEGVRLIRELLGSELMSAHLFTSGADLRIEITRRGEPRLAARAPTLQEAA